jgi:hypothetical protein
MSALICLVGMEMLLGGTAARQEAPKAVAPTTVKLGMAKVTDTEALYIWDIEGPGWRQTSTKQYRTSFETPATEGRAKGTITITLKAVHYKGKGMDVTLIRTMHQGPSPLEGSSSSNTHTFIGLPAMPLSKLLSVRTKQVTVDEKTGVIPLADLNVPASQYSNFEWRRAFAKGITPYYSKRVKLKKDGQPDNAVFKEPDAARLMSQENLVLHGQVTQAEKATFEIEFK